MLHPASLETISSAVITVTIFILNLGENDGSTVCDLVVRNSGADVGQIPSQQVNWTFFDRR